MKKSMAAWLLSLIIAFSFGLETNGATSGSNTERKLKSDGSNSPSKKNVQLKERALELCQQPPNLTTAKKWFALIKDINSAELQQLVFKSVGAALVCDKKADTYKTKIRKRIKDADEFDKTMLANCPACGGKKKRDKKCSDCAGDGICKYSNCKGGQHLVRGFKGPNGGGGDHYENCRKCAGSGKCQKCQGNGVVTVKCYQCNGKGKSFSIDNASQSYYLVVKQIGEVFSAEEGCSNAQPEHQVAQCNQDSKSHGEKKLQAKTDASDGQGKPRQLRNGIISNIRRVQEFDCVWSHPKHIYGPTFQLRGLSNGNFNYIIYDDYSATESSGTMRMVVFNHKDIYAVSRALKLAIEKAYQWIEIGRKNNHVLSDYKDLGIEIPNGCAIEIPPALDSWMCFREMANIPNHKKMPTSIKFSFSTEYRFLLLQCGEVCIVFKWRNVNDSDIVASFADACDVGEMHALITGRPGEASLFCMDQAYEDIPVINGASRLPEWDVGYISVLAGFPGNKSLTFSRCDDGSYNYGFGPYKLNDVYNENLIFPNNSYDAAYRALHKAFRVALAWRDIARKANVLNMVKEIDVPCPDSASIKITGKIGYFDLFNKACTRKYTHDDVKRTRFWFVVRTEPTMKNMNEKKYCYDSERSSYALVFENADVIECLKIDDETISAFRLMDPQIALKKMNDTAKADEIFK